MSDERILGFREEDWTARDIRVDKMDKGKMIGNTFVFCEECLGGREVGMMMGETGAFWEGRLSRKKKDTDDSLPTIGIGTPIRLESIVYRGVDIFFAAGPNDDYEHTCQGLVRNTCSIFRVRWDVFRRQPIYVGRIFEAGVEYAWHPTVSPPSDDLLPWKGTGEKLAYMVNRDGARRIEVVSTDDTSEVETWGDVENDLLHPHWHDKDTLLLNYTESGTYPIGLAAIMKDRDVDSLEVDTTISSAPVVHLDDPATHQDVPSCGSRPGGTLIVLMAEEDGSAFGEHKPRVVSLSSEGSVDEEFDLSVDPAENGVSSLIGCHHPAWSPDGKKILCTALDDNLASQQIHDGDDHKLHPVFVFEADCSASPVQWGSGVRAFQPIPQAELEAHFPAFSGKFSDAAATYSMEYKYAEWCYSDDLYVVTLILNKKADGALDVTCEASRVMLYDARDNMWWDLTTVAEHQFGDSNESASRSWMGAYSTCSASTRMGGRVSYGGIFDTYSPVA